MLLAPAALPPAAPRASRIQLSCHIPVPSSPPNSSAPSQHQHPPPPVGTHGCSLRPEHEGCPPRKSISCIPHPGKQGAPGAHSHVEPMPGTSVRSRAPQRALGLLQTHSAHKILPGAVIYSPGHRSCRRGGGESLPDKRGPRGLAGSQHVIVSADLCLQHVA